MGRQHQRVNRTGVRQLPEGCYVESRKGWREPVAKSLAVPPTILTAYGNSDVWSEEDMNLLSAYSHDIERIGF